MARTRSLEYDDKRQTILDQAAILFAEKGFARTSIAELSRRCNASKAWIYHYYDSKEAILHAILEGHIADLLEAAESAVAAAGSEPRDRLAAFIRAVIGVYRGANEKHTVLLNDLAILPDAAQQSVIRLERQVVDLLCDILDALNPDLKTERALRKPVAMSLLGTLNWTYTWFRDDGPMDYGAYTRLVTDLYLSGVKGVTGKGMLEPSAPS